MPVQLQVALIAFAGALLGAFISPFASRLWSRKDPLVEARREWAEAALRSFRRVLFADPWDRVQIDNMLADDPFYVVDPPEALLIMDGSSAEGVRAWLDTELRLLDQWWEDYLRRDSARRLLRIAAEDRSPFDQHLEETIRTLSRWAARHRRYSGRYFRRRISASRRWRESWIKRHRAQMAIWERPDQRSEQRANG